MINGTDYPPGDRVDGLSAALHELFLMHGAGLSTIKSLQSITSTAADLVNRSESIGQIRPGFMGDFVAFHGNPIEDPQNLRNIDFVMQGGKSVVSNL